MRTRHIRTADCEQKPRRSECPSFAFALPDRPAPMNRTRHSNAYAFTAAEHLRVQQEIEERAHDFWRKRAERPDNALNNWLRAESEVVARFIRTRLWFADFQPPKSPVSKSTHISRQRL
jgi:DUF2934 family protein